MAAKLNQGPSHPAYQTSAIYIDQRSVFHILHNFFLMNSATYQIIKCNLT